MHTRRQQARVGADELLCVCGRGREDRGSTAWHGTLQAMKLHYGWLASSKGQTLLSAAALLLSAPAVGHTKTKLSGDCQWPHASPAHQPAHHQQLPGTFVVHASAPHPWAPPTAQPAQLLGAGTQNKCTEGHTTQHGTLGSSGGTCVSMSTQHRLLHSADSPAAGTATRPPCT